MSQPATIEIRRATVDDVPLLAAMNRRLIEDENSSNPMSLDQLADRMRGWLDQGWSMVIITEVGTVVGYALFRERHDEYFPEKRDIYVRQFFIERDHRGQGLGRTAFERISNEFFHDRARIVIEVLEANSTGRRFWESVGFLPHCTIMHRIG